MDGITAPSLPTVHSLGKHVRKETDEKTALKSFEAYIVGEMLRRAAEGGDESAAATCDQLLSEAKAREEEALFKLRALASGGDSRARAVLEHRVAWRDERVTGCTHSS